MWHLHAYSHTNDESALKQFQGAITSRFAEEPQFRYNRLAMVARGPHPCAQMEFGEALANYGRLPVLNGTEVLTVR